MRLDAENPLSTSLTVLTRPWNSAGLNRPQEVSGPTSCLIRVSHEIQAYCAGLNPASSPKHCFIYCRNVNKCKYRACASYCLGLSFSTQCSLQESEIQLLQEAKRLSVDLEQQQHELEKAEQFPEESSSEVCRIRQQLLNCQNEYNAIKEREHEIQFRIKWYVITANLCLFYRSSSEKVIT